MSYTELYAVSRKGRVTLYQEFPNAWRGAMLIWRKLAEIYLPDVDFGMMMIREKAQQLWDLAKDERVSLAHRITLASTFDRVIVRREDFEQLIAAWEQFIRDVDDSGHLPAQIVALRGLPHRYLGVCWNQTSVSEGPWWVQGSNGRERHYDITRETNHWFLFPFKWQKCPSPLVQAEQEQPAAGEAGRLG